MSEPLAECLSRFTPNTTGLDRDTLLFAAGRASVRPSRRWQTLAGVLAVSQVLTLVCLWPRAAPPSSIPFVASKPSRPDSAPEPQSQSNLAQWRALRQRMLE